jgi:hypothetical protein
MEKLYQHCLAILVNSSPYLFTHNELMQLRALQKCTETGPNLEIYTPENTCFAPFYDWIAWKDQTVNLCQTHFPHFLASAQQWNSAGNTTAQQQWMAEFRLKAREQFVQLMIHLCQQLPFAEKPRCPDLPKVQRTPLCVEPAAATSHRTDQNNNNISNQNNSNQNNNNPNSTSTIIQYNSTPQTVNASNNGSNGDSGESNTVALARKTGYRVVAHKKTLHSTIRLQKL